MAGPDPATVQRFSVIVDVDAEGQTDLGAFSTCQGLKADYSLSELPEGGENGFVRQLVGPLKYEPVQLSRPLDSHSGVVASWFFGFRSNPLRTTARISALAPDGATIAAWTLSGVVPSTWTGPQFDASGNGVARESLTLRHEGFVLE